MMAAAASLSASDWIEWGVAGRPLPGEVESGDLHVVAQFDGGALAAAIDGLGHGPEAAEAARRAAGVLAADPGAPLTRLFERCHAALRGSRGAVMTLVAVDARANRMSWAAVGNVEAVLFRASPGAAPARETVVPRGGVVGHQLAPPRERSLPIAAGDVLVLATDGVRHDFISTAPDGASPDAFAARLLERYASGRDDALVLVVRYRGHAP